MHGTEYDVVKLGFLVNRLETEKAQYTTTLLVQTAARRGHDVYRMDVASLSCGADATVKARAAKVASGDSAEVIVGLKANIGEICSIELGQLDTLLLRNDPAEDVCVRSKS